MRSKTHQRRAVSTAIIALVAVAIIVVAAVAYFSVSNPGGPTTGPAESTSSSIQSTTCSAGGTVTETVGQSGPPCGCVLVDSNANGSLYVSSNPKVGDNVCIQASLNDSRQVYLSITNSTGSAVFSPAPCVATGVTGAPAPTGDTCTAFWNTAKPDPLGNAIEPGAYLLVASDFEGSAAALEANFTLSSANISSQSTTSSQAKTVTECMETITTTFVNVTRTQTATEEITCVASSSGLSVSGLSLCPTNCVYPAPYLTGQLNVNGASPLSRIDVYVNGTFDGTPVQNPSATSPGCISSGNHTTCSTGSVVTNTLTRFAYIYKGSIPNEFIPAVVGDRYVVTFVASFQDGSSALASAIVVATS